jgi:hypothetical protein
MDLDEWQNPLTDINHEHLLNSPLDFSKVNFYSNFGLVEKQNVTCNSPILMKLTIPHFICIQRHINNSLTEAETFFNCHSLNSLQLLLIFRQYFADIAENLIQNQK